MRLRGTEALTLEVGVALPPARAREMVPARFEVEPRGSLLVFHMTGLVMEVMPFPSFDYFEALWRVSVRFEGAPAWFAVACDIDHPIVRGLGARLIKYPTRAAKIIGSEALWKVDGASAGALALRVSDVDRAELPTLRRTFVGSNERLYEIPWDEVPPVRARSVAVTVKSDALVRATFGEGAKLDDTGIVHRGRVHICGSARRLRER